MKGKILTVLTLLFVMGAASYADAGKPHFSISFESGCMYRECRPVPCPPPCYYYPPCYVEEYYCPCCPHYVEEVHIIERPCPPPCEVFYW